MNKYLLAISLILIASLHADYSKQFSTNNISRELYSKCMHLGSDKFSFFGNTINLNELSSDKFGSEEQRNVIAEGILKISKVNPFKFIKTEVIEASKAPKSSEKKSLMEIMQQPNSRLSHDGTKFLSFPKRSNLINVFDNKNGKLISSMRHAFDIQEATFSKDGKLVIACGGEALMSWNVKNGSPTHFIPLTKGPEEANKLIPCAGKNLAILETLNHGTSMKSLYLWDMDRYKLVNIVKDFKIIQASFNSSFSKLFISSDDSFKVWDFRSRDMSEYKHDGAFKSAHFSADDNNILMAYEDNTLKIWNVPSKSFAHTMYIDNDIASIEFSRNDEVLIHHKDKTKSLWQCKKVYHPGRLDEALLLALSNIWYLLGPLTKDRKTNQLTYNPETLKNIYKSLPEAGKQYVDDKAIDPLIINEEL